MTPTKEQMQQYLQRFEGSVPLVIYPLDPYPYKCKPDFVESEIDLEWGFSAIKNIECNKEYKIIAGFNKAKLADFMQFDWLCGGGEIPDLFNKRLVDTITQICPEDFIALNVTLINLSDKLENYENKDFYIVNALNTLDAIDKEQSTWSYAYEGAEGWVLKRVYKEDPWQGHLLAFESSISQMIWHPRLAKALYPSKQFQFLTPEEDSYWSHGGFPEGYDKASWFDYLRIKNKMAYPGPRLSKILNS